MCDADALTARPEEGADSGRASEDEDVRCAFDLSIVAGVTEAVARLGAQMEANAEATAAATDELAPSVAEGAVVEAAAAAPADEQDSAAVVETEVEGPRGECGVSGAE